MLNFFTHKPNIITLNRMAMRLGFLRSKILILVLVLVGWLVEVEGKSYNRVANACGGGFIMGSSLHSITPNAVPTGLRDKGTWTVPAGLSFSDMGQNPVISGFVQGSSYVITWTAHNGDDYNYTISVPVSASSFNLTNLGSTDPVLLTDAESYPVLLEVDPAGGSSYSFFYQDINTKTISTGPAGASPTYNFTPANQNSVNGVYALVTEDVGGVTCQSKTNVIQIAKENVTVQVIGGKSVCDGDFNFLLEVIPFSPSLDYEWTVPGGALVPGQTVNVATYGAGTYSVSAYRKPLKAQLISKSADVEVGNYILSSSILPSPTVGICEGNSISLAGAGASTPATGNPIDYEWIRNGVSGYVSGNGMSSNISVNTSGEFVYKIYETNNPLCYAFSDPTHVQLTINANPMPVSGSHACVGSSINNIRLDNSEVGVEYRLMFDDGVSTTEVSNWTSTANGQTYTFPPVSGVGSYTVQAIGCTGVVNMAGGPFVISPLPKETLNVILNGSGCEGDPHTITVENSESGVAYQLFNGATAASLVTTSAGGDLIFAGVTTAGDYTVRASRNGCMVSLDQGVRIGVVPVAQTFSPSTACSDTPFTLTLANSEAGVQYTIYNAANTPLYSQNSGGGSLSFTVNQPVGTYTIVAQNGDGCTRDIGTFTLQAPPITTYTLQTDDNPACAVNGPHTIRLNGSQPGFTYRLLNGATVVSSVVAPAAGGILDLASTSVAGTYTLEVSNGGCILPMPTSLTIVAQPNNIPAVAGEYCDGDDVEVRLNNSQSGAIYRLYRDGLLYASEVEVTGIGGAIVFADKFPPGEYTVGASFVSGACERIMTGQVVVNALPNAEINPFSDHYCADAGTVTIGGRPQIGTNDWWVSGFAVNPTWFTEGGSTASIDVVDLLNTQLGASDRVSLTFNYYYQDPVTGCEASASEVITFVDDQSDNLNFQYRMAATDPWSNFAGDLVTCQSIDDILLQAIFIDSSLPTASGVFTTNAPTGSITNSGTGDEGAATFHPSVAGNGLWAVTYTYMDPASGCQADITYNIQVGTTLSLHGLSAQYCADNNVDQEWFGLVTGGQLIVAKDGGPTESVWLLDPADRYVFNPQAKGAGNYEVTYRFTSDPGGANECINEITQDITVRADLDATFDTDGGRRIYCLTNGSVDLLPAPVAGSTYSGTGVGMGVFNPALAGVGTHRITHTVQDGFCSVSEFIDVEVVAPDVAVVLDQYEFCYNETGLFPVEAGDMPVVGGVYSRDQADKTVAYTFSTDAVNALFRFQADGVTRDYASTFTVSHGDTPIYFDPSRVPAIGGSDLTINIYLEYDSPVDEGGCEVYSVQPILVKSVQAVNFGSTEPMEFCQNSTPVIMEGRFSSSGAAVGSGYFSADFPMDNEVDGAGTGNNGRALFDPSLVTPTSAYQITYHYENPNGCVSKRTKSFEIKAAPIKQRVTPIDPNGGIFCQGSGGVTIGLQGTQIDVRYILQKDGVDVNAAVQYIDGQVPGNTPRTFPNPVTEPGVYTVRAIMIGIADGCDAIMEGSVIVDEKLVVGVLESMTHETCAGSNDGELEFSAYGGISPYIYTLSNGDVSASGVFSGLAPGTYTVTIEDAVGCNWTSGNIVINVGNTISILASAEKNVVCFGESNGSFTVTATGLPSGNYEFLLSGSATWVSNGTGKYIFNNLPAGTYDVTVRDANSAGCQAVMSPSVVITQPAAAVSIANFAVTPVTCSLANIGSIEVEAAGGDQASGFNYVLYREVSPGFWVNIAASGAPVAFGTAHTFPNLFPGNYRIVASDTKGCSVTAVYTVDGPTSLPSIILSGDEIVHVSQSGLSDGAIEVAISGGKEPYNIVWIEIDALGGATVGAPLTPGMYRQDNLAAGFYRITVTDDNGCNDVLEAEVLDDAVSAFDLTFTTVNPGPCNGSSNGRINLRAVGGITPYLKLSLTNGAGQVMTATTAGNSFASYENLQAGNYTATVVDTRGVSLSEVIMLTQPAAPVVISHSIADATCFGGDGSVKFSATGGAVFAPVAPATDNYYKYSIVPTSGISINGDLNEGDEITQNLPAGDYLLTIRDAVTCFDVVNFMISEPDAMSIVVESRKHNLCKGASDGSITVSVSGRTGGTAFDFEWERYDEVSSLWTPIAGETSASISGLAAGNYRVRATEAAGSACPSDFSGAITIGEPAEDLVVVAKPTNITTCLGDATGSVRLSVTGGTAPYTIAYGTVSISWNGLNDYIVTDLLVGTYNFTITDYNGCFVEESATIAEPALFAASVAGSGIDCETPNTGWIDLITSGGIDNGGFAYSVQVIRQENNQIFHNQTHNDPVAGLIEIDNLPAGIYTVRVWDANSTAPDGCRKTFEVELRNMVVNASVKHPDCTGLDNGSIEAIVTGGSGDYTFAWTGPGTFTSTAPLIHNLEPGTYELTVTDNINGCSSATRSYLIDYAYTLAVTASVADVSCFGGTNGSITALPSGGMAPYFYLWEEEVTPGNWSPLTNTATLSNRAAGTYRVTVTDANNCEVVSADVDIDQPDDFDIATISYTRETVSCYGGADGSLTVNTNRVGNFEYSIDAVNWQILPTFENLAAGSYRISIRDMDQPAPYCAKYEIETATILEADPIAISLGNKVNVNCYGDNTGSLSVSVLGGTAPYTYQWYVATGTGNIPLAGETSDNVTGLMDGDYFVRVKDNNSCSATSNVYTITQPASAPLMSVVSNQSVSALNGSDGSITVAISGGTPGYSIAWTGVDYLLNDVTASLTQNVLTLNNLRAGTYTATVTDDNGCTDDITIIVSQPGDALTLSEIRVNPQPCNGATNGSVELTAAGGALPYTFTLIRNPGTEMTVLFVSGNKAFYNDLAAGFYTARVRDNNGNVVELTNLELTQPLPVEIYDITPANTTCFGEDDGSIEFSIRGGTPHATTGYSYILRPENGTDIIGYGDVNITVPNLVPDNYTLSVYDVTNTCFAEHSFALTQPDDIIIAAKKITPVSCNGESDGSIRIEVSGGIDGAYTYEWFLYNTTTSSWDAIAGSNTAWLQNLAAGRYYVEVTELGGAACTKESSEFVLSEPAALTATATAFDVNTCTGDNSGRIKVVISGGVGPYLVDYGIGTQTGAGSEFFIEDLVADDYTLVVTDNNGSGCQTVATVKVGEPDEALSVTTPVVTYSCVLPSIETHSVSFNINGGVGINNGTDDAFTYNIEVVNTITSGRKTKTVAATTDQPVMVNLDDLNLGLGSYRLIVTDAQAAASANCTAVEHVFTISRMAVSQIVSPVSCPGAADGSIDISVTGGSGSYAYAWVKDSSPMTETSQDLSGLSDGNYTLTVTDVSEAGRCPVTRTYTVSNAKKLVVESSIEPVKCFGGNNGAIRINGVANAASGISYYWNGAAVAGTNELTGLVAGDYSVEIIDGDGCRVQESFTVTQPIAPLLVDLSQSLDCTLDTRSITAVESGGTGPFVASSFAWSGPGAYTLSADGRSIYGITTGGNYKVQVTDALGCQTSKIIRVYGKVQVSTDVAPINCNGGTVGSINLDVKGGSGDYTYIWTKDGLPFAQTTKDINNLGAGTYRVTVTDNLQNCDVTTKYSVTLNDIIVSQPDLIEYVSVTPKDITRCNGDLSGEIAIRVKGGSGTYFLDYNEDGINDYTSFDGYFAVAGLAAGSYQLRVTDTNGCATVPALNPVTIAQPDPLTLVLDQTITTIDCIHPNTGVIAFAVSGGNRDASGNPSYKISVSGQADKDIYTEGATQNYPNLPAGTYIIQVQDMLASEPAACAIVRQTVVLEHIQITGDEIPNACAVTSNNIGAIRNIQINGTSDIPTWQGDAAPSNSVWYWDETATGGDPVTDNTQLNQENLPVGEYVLVVIDKGRDNCEVRKNFIVDAVSTLNITGTAVPVSCYGAGDGLISGIEVTGTFNYSYTWTGSGVDNSLILSDGQNNLEAGTYVLSVTDNDNGCQVSKSFVITEPDEITYDLAEVVESCSPYRRGINLILPAGETRTFNYTWTGADGVVGNTKNLTGLKKGGQYNVIVSDYSCHVTKSISIADTVRIKTDVTPLDCHGDANGVIAVPEITGGSGNFSYEWTKDGVLFKSGTDISDINISGLSAGTYKLTLTDQGISDGVGACVYVDSVILSQPDLIVATGDIKHITCNGAQNGAINISVYGGTAPYTYIWTTIDGVGFNKLSQNQKGISGGTYTVQVKDAKGCISAETQFIVNEVDAIDFDLNRDDTDCDGTNGKLEINNFSGGSNKYKYLWSTNDGSGIVQNSPTQTLTGGTYTIKVWDEDYPTCFLEKQATLTKAITIAPTVTNQTCNSNANGSIDVVVTGGVAPYTYEWTPAVGITNVNQASQSNLSKGTYVLKVTDSRAAVDGGPCGLTVSVDVDLDYDIQAEVNVSHVSCQGGNNGSISLTKVTGAMAGNYAFLWTGLPAGKVATDQNQSGLPAGSYTVKITDKNSDCFINKTIVINEPDDAVTITSINVTDIDCKGDASGTIEVVAVGGTPFKDALGNDYYKYAWVGPGIGLVQDSPNQANLSAGIYTVSVIDSKGNTDGCVAFSGNVVVTEPNAAIAATVFNVQHVSAQGGNNGAIQLSTSGGSGSLHYAWSGLAFDGTTVISVAHIGSNPTGLVAGKYNVVITDDKGCSFTLENIIVEEPNLPLRMEVATENIRPCNGDANGQIHVDAFGGKSPYTITLLQGAVIINEVVANQMDEVGLSQGIYVVRIKDANNVVITKNDVEIAEPAPLLLSASVGTHVLCAGSATGSLSYTIAGGNATYNVLVTGPGSYKNEAKNLMAGTYPLTGLAAGTYRILMIDNNSGNGNYLLHENCYKETTVTITQPNALVTISDNSTICKGESTNIRLSVSNYTGVYPLSIKLSDGSTKIMTSSNQTFEVNPLVDTQYTIIEVLNNAGTCTQGSGEGSALVTVNDIPSAHIELIGDDEVCLGEEFSFSIHFEGEGPFNVSYTNGSVQTDLNNILAKDTLIKVIPLESTTYQIAAMSDANCTGTFTGAAIVVVNELPSVTMDIAPDDAVICKGSSSHIRFSFPSGTANYQVRFTENGVLRSINATPLVAGSYSLAVSPKVTTSYKLISVSDANNCEVAVNEVTQTITVNESPENAGDIIGKTLVCQGEQLVTYRVHSIGFADSYIWEVPPSMGTIASQTDTIITINFKDDFVSGSISVKGKNDCGEGVAFVLPITTKKLPLKPDKPAGITSMCAGSTGITYSIPAVNHAIRYEWLLPIGFKYANDDSTGTSIMVDIKEGYTDFVGDISVIAINNCGESQVSDALTVTVNPFPLAVADKGNLSNRACASTYSLNAVDPGVGYTGVWTSNRNIGTGLVTSGQENVSSASIYNLSQGANAFIWTVTNDLTGCSTSDEVIIYNDLVTVFAVADQYTVCDGEVKLTGTPLSSVDAAGGTGVWSTPNGAILTPANAASTVATNMARGENTFTWTIQKGGCPSSATIKVINNQPTEAVIKNALDVIIAQQDLPCGDNFTRLKGSVPAMGEETGYWIIESGSVSIDNSNSPDIQITNIPAGDHVLSWNILNGSCVSTTTVKIRNNSFNVDAGKDDFTCDGSIQLNATPLSGGATGQWTTVVGTFDDATKATTTVRNLTQTGNGENVLRWTVRRNGCESFDEVVITNNQPSKAQIQGDVTSATVCDSVFVLNAVDPQPYGEGIWSLVSGKGSFENSTAHNTKVRGFEHGENIYRWTVYNKTCSSSVDFKVTNLHVVAYAGADTAVCGTTASLNALPAPNDASGTWSVVNGMGSGSFRPTTQYPVGSENPNASVESLSSGSNHFVWKINNDGCISTDTVVVSNNAPSPVSVTPAVETDDDFVWLYADPLTTPGTGLWTLLEGRGTILNPTSPTTKIENLFPNINRFRWTVTNLNCSDYVDVEVKSGALAEANAGWDQLELCEDYTTLQANLPANTFGEWTIQSGAVQFENNEQNNAKVKIYNIRPGRNVLKWTLKFVGSGTQSTSDTVVIVNNKPSDAYAGYDITECGDRTQLNAKAPAIGNPLWTILSGGGIFNDDKIAKPIVTNLAPGENVLKYQIQNNMCFSYDTLKVFNMEPSEANGGGDQTVCVDSAEIRPTIPKYGNGTWRVIQGAGKGKDNKGNYTNSIEGNYVYALAPGINKLVWEVQVPGAAANCINRDTITIVNNQPSLAYAGANRPTCTDTVTLSGSVPIYGIGTWTLISGSGEIADSSHNNTLVRNLGKGKNRFRWTVDNNGCPSVSEVEISNNFIQADAGDLIVNCADTAVLEANNPAPGIGSWGVKGGSGSAQFNNNADPYTIVRNLDKGENILTWTIDHKGCPSVSEVKVVNNAPSKADAGDNKPTCENSFVLGGSNPEVGTGIWSIRSGGGKFLNDLNPSTRVDSLMFGDNIFRWTVENEGCYDYDDVQISFNTIEAKVAGDQDICSDRVFLEANSALPGLGTWTVVGGGSQAKFVDSHDPVTEAYDLAKGKNRLKWTINNKGCITSKEVEITNHTPSTAYAGNTQEFCREETVLDATPVAAGLGTGKWEILTGSAIIPASELGNPKAHITGLSKGENVLRWIVTSDNGLCDSKDDVRIINNLPSVPYAGKSDEYCSPTVVLKAATPDFGTGRWSIEEGGGDFNDPALPNATIVNLKEGKNVLRWTVSQGQCSLFSDIEVINNTPTTSDAGPDIDDCKDYATLDANLATQGTGYWSLTSGNADFKDKSNAKTLVNNLTFGANILRWNIQKGKCISSDEIVVNNNVPDQADAGTQRETCENYITLNANDPTTGMGTWHVLSGNGDFDDLHSPISIVRNLKLGENKFQWVVSYGSCTTEDEVEIISNKAAPYAGEDDVSYEPSYELKASNPGKLGAKWSLVAGDGVFEDETFYNTRVNGLREGINTFRWLMNINNCVTYDDVSIDYRMVPDASFKVDTFQGCYPLRVQFTNQSIGGSSYSWDFGDERYSSERNPVHTFRQPGEYTVTLTAPGPDNVDGIYQTQILVHDHPVADFTYGPDVLYVPGDVLRAYSNSMDAHKYLWNFGDGNTSTQVNPAYKYKDTGVYTISLQVTSANNCVDEMVKVNAVEVRAEGFVVFPNSFMPRPDGGSSSSVGGGETNSVFRPVYKDVETYKLQVFNRWGQLIYEGDDIAEGWNGFFNGQLSPQAVYVYKATGTFISGKEFNESGSVLLVR